MPLLDVTKQTCIAYSEGRFFEGSCEFCTNAMECEQLRFKMQELHRKPTDDWMDVKGKHHIKEE